MGLDDPEIFDNVGKYPICFTLGCNSGNMHTTGVSLSESFIFSSKGDIVYICLLYTSDAADERSSVDLGGRGIIKKKNKKK